ncbi:hypothetical protein [Tumebacillus permanentifrigoris]|uniref:Uncharacterized protein n=1 Tax=Tumebacillus permanentifrigoris TaxID=378543 RepID=A0A316D8F7_9BACL|nr:hypothetical protein [Tumebacillus permanentifrigoris]PWK10208.1 hypothetical protein C7459_11229 [Tumebacillus permanentifrigoris]
MKQPSQEALRNLCKFFMNVALPRMTEEQFAQISNVPSQQGQVA